MLTRLLVAAGLLLPFVAAAEGHEIPVQILIAQAGEESKFDPLAENERSGCRGIAQFSEKTWYQFGTEDFDEAFDPLLAIPAQARYLGWLRDQLGGNWCWILASYVWGIGRVQSLLSNGGSWQDVPWWVREYAEEILVNSEVDQDKHLFKKNSEECEVIVTDCCKSSLSRSDRREP